MRWLDRELEGKEFIGVERYDMADITAQVALLTARGVAKLPIPEDHKNLSRWWGRCRSGRRRAPRRAATRGPPRPTAGWQSRRSLVNGSCSQTMAITRAKIELVSRSADAGATGAWLQTHRISR